MTYQIFVKEQPSDENFHDNEGDFISQYQIRVGDVLRTKHFASDRPIVVRVIEVQVDVTKQDRPVIHLLTVMVA